MSEIIHTSSRGTVEVFEKNGEKRIRRTLNAELPLYETLKNSRCAYLPKIYSVDIGDGVTVVSEEFISGKNLTAVNLDEKQTVHIMVQLCAALDFIHGLGIVHRDIKPSNILLSEDSNIRLIDFEAARFVREDKDKDTRYLGTDGFAPPEQYGFSQTDFRADIYAAGQTMKILLGSLSAKRKYAKIICKCTALDPAERYQSAKALADALTKKREKISAAALTAAALLVTLLAAFVPKESPAENITDTAEIAAETEVAVLETTAASETETAVETESFSETTVPTETESTMETTNAAETETTAATETNVETETVSETTTAALETTAVPETELITETTAASKTETAAAAESSLGTSVPTETKSVYKTTTAAKTEITSITETSSETKNSDVITAIPDNLPITISPHKYASSPEKQPYYTKVNVQKPAYAWIGDSETGFNVDNGSYVLKNTFMWVAMYNYDYINYDILINGKIVNASSSGGSSNFGIEYTIGLDESVVNIKSQPTVSRKSTVRLEDNDIEVNYFVNGWTNGGHINNGDAVRYDTPILIGCYKNLIAGYDITVNGKALPVQINGDNTYMLGLYTPDSRETVISKTKRNNLTEYEKTNYVPVYFSSEIHVAEFPFSKGFSLAEFNISYSNGALLAKGSTLRIYVLASDYAGKTLKINGSTVDMLINGDGDYITDYIIPNNAVSVDIALK